MNNVSIIACRTCGRPFTSWEGVYDHHIKDHKDVPIASKFSHKNSGTAYRELHALDLKRKRHEYYLRHKDEERARADAWAKAHPERLREVKRDYQRKRRAAGK